MKIGKKLSKTEKISNVRKQISQYISRNRLSKVTIFFNNEYYGTLIFSKKSGIYGFSRLNRSDKKIDKSIGTFYAMTRFINNLSNKDFSEIDLLYDINKSLPKGYKNFAKNPNPKDKIVDRILFNKQFISTGYTRINWDVQVIRYEVLQINGLDVPVSSQNLTYNSRKIQFGG